MSFSGVEDTVLVGSLSGSDADGDIIQYLLATGATHGTVTLSQTGVFTYTPSQNFNGVDTFAYKATDGTLSGNTEIVTLDVSSVNDVPVAIADTGSTNKNIATSIDILANDIDVDHPVESLIPTIVTQPTNGSLVHSGTIYIYTPNTNYCGGADTFSYFVTDGSGGVSMTVSDSIDVVCVNDPPVAVDDSLSVQEDGSGVVLMLQNDTDPNIGSGDILRLESIVTTPLHGTASLIHTGTPSQIGVTDEAIFYTPEANYCGTDALSYRIADATGSISNTAMVHITIDCVNDIPVTQSIALNGLMDTTLTGQISVTDIDSSMFTYNLTTTPVSGSASIDASGVVTYIPNLGFTGTETLPFTVTDNSGGVSLPRFIQVALSAPSRVVAYSGTVQTSTGEVRLFTGTTQALSVGYTLDLSGKTITALSSSGLTGSIVLP
jgi:Bacterial Ig domain